MRLPQIGLNLVFPESVLQVSLALSVYSVFNAASDYMGRCKAGMRMWKQREMEVRRFVCIFRVSTRTELMMARDGLSVWCDTSV